MVKVCPAPQARPRRNVWRAPRLPVASAATADLGGSEDALLRRLSDVMGRDFADNALTIDAERDGVRLTGHAGLPTLNRNTTKHQYLFVNGRPVRDRLLTGAVRGAYQDFLARGRHPLVALFVEIDPELVDVNVHPAKAEVRFRDPGVVRGLIVGGLRHALAAAGHRASTTVADAALLLEVISGHDPLDSTSIAEPAPGLLSVLDQGVEGLRIGILDELSGHGVEGISPDVLARLDAAVEALTAAGATVERASVPATVYGLSAYYVIAPAEASSNLSRYDGVRFGPRTDGATTNEMMMATRTEGFGDEVKRRIMLGTYALSAGYYDAYYGKSQKVRTLILKDFAEAYEKFDLLISPTAPTTAFPLGDKTEDPMQMYLQDVCTIPSNLAGHPAMSVPFGVGDDGLPVGVQILAPAMGEATMFRAAAVLEKSGGAQ